jgi:hypothetical protein
MQVHAEAKGNDGGLQKKFRHAPAFSVKWVGCSESVNQAAQKREGWRN